jgi:hypothetical protein
MKATIRKGILEVIAETDVEKNVLKEWCNDNWDDNNDKIDGSKTMLYWGSDFPTDGPDSKDGEAVSVERNVMAQIYKILDDCIVIYAAECCSDEQCADAGKRILEAGGVLAYLAHGKKLIKNMMP